MGEWKPWRGSQLSLGRDTDHRYRVGIWGKSWIGPNWSAKTNLIRKIRFSSFKKGESTKFFLNKTATFAFFASLYFSSTKRPRCHPWKLGNKHLYIGRAQHDGGVFPGTLVPQKGVAHIPWGGLNYEKKEYQVEAFYYWDTLTLFPLSGCQLGTLCHFPWIWGMRIWE